MATRASTAAKKREGRLRGPPVCCFGVAQAPVVCAVSAGRDSSLTAMSARLPRRHQPTYAERRDFLYTVRYEAQRAGLEPELVLALIQRAVELRPRSGVIVDSLGWAYYRLGDYPQALEFLERAVELEPAHPTLNDHLGDVYWRLGRRIEARFQWERALTLDPDDAEAIRTKLERGLPPESRSAER